ncbi:MAG TPA: hypothetical protein EYQ86_03840 [Bacteroidetes bacterium]|nr:hypothetical protein [Bacteroidota bacterium]
MTNLLYLDNTYLFETSAKFIELKENEKGTAIILDQTIFYPQGGGQPADTGKIILGSNEFIVTDVRLDEQGLVWHFGTFNSNPFNNGDEVDLEDDGLMQYLNNNSTLVCFEKIKQQHSNRNNSAHRLIAQPPIVGTQFPSTIAGILAIFCFYSQIACQLICCIFSRAKSRHDTKPCVK